MADLAAAATGNLTAAGTWGSIDATSLLDSEAASTAVSTSNLDSSTFVLPASAVDCIYMKLAARLASPTGTVTVILRNSTTSTDVITVTVNVSDLPASGMGFIAFKAGSTHTPNGTDSYLIRTVCSNTGSQVTWYRNATSNNWSRRIRNTTTQAPAAGNHLIIANELTGAGTSNTRTVTIDNTATTSFGPTVSGGPPQGIMVCNGGILTLGTASSTNYYFRWKGIFLVCGGGTLNLGSSGGRLSSTSTCVFEMDSASLVDTGFRADVGSTVNVYGATKTTVQTLMTADKAAAATVITLASTTDWANSDELAFGSTSRTSTECEKKTVSSVDSSTQVTLTAGLTNAHKGTTQIQAEVVNLTRNIKFRGISNSLCGYVYIETTATVNFSYVEFLNLGGAADPKLGITVKTTTGASLFEFCSVHDTGQVNTAQYGFNLRGSTLNNVTVNTCVGYNCFMSFLRIDSATSGTSITVTNNVAILCSSNGNENGYVFQDVGGVLFGNTVVGSAAIGFSFGEATSTGISMDNTVAHSCANTGIAFTQKTQNLTATGIKSWRNGGAGLSNSAYWEDIAFVSATIFGNSTRNVSITAGWSKVTFSGGNIASDTSFATTNAFELISCSSFLVELFLNNVTLDSTTSPWTRHTTDVEFTNTQNAAVQVHANKTALNPLTSVMGANFLASTGANCAAALKNSYFRAIDYNATAGDHRTLTPIGNILLDTTIFNSASPSERMTPLSSTVKFTSGCFTKGVDSGATVSFSVTVRKSVVGDGTAYNGNQPRLVLKRNDALGNAAETVLATAAGAAGSFETLTGSASAASENGTFEVYVDCDGTLGWVNVDDWS